MRHFKLHSISRQPATEQGFTIVELMIATMIFTVILLVITVGVIHFTNDYYRGVHASTTQTTAQDIVDTVSQAVQFSGGGSGEVQSGPSGNSFFCAGSKVFVYKQGEMYDGSSSTVGLKSLTKAGKDCTYPSSLSSADQLLAPSMRVASLTMSAQDADQLVWSISLTLAYGESDLLCNAGTSGPGGCGSSDAVNAPGSLVQGDDVVCKSQSGSQFCAVSHVATLAQQRIGS